MKNVANYPVRDRQRTRSNSTALFEKLGNTFSLIPLQGKRPIERNWEQWCKKKRRYQEDNFSKGLNVGVCCGTASGVLVLDIDNPRKFRAVRDENGWSLPPTYVVRTGGSTKGSHYYYRYPQDGKFYGNKSYRDLGFDIRGDGGQVVAEGSTHPDTGNLYTRLRLATPNDIADPPQWLLDLYSSEKPVEQKGVDCTVDVDALSVSRVIKKLIKEGKPQGERSQAEIKVINALVEAGLSDHSIEEIFSLHTIGERWREKGGDHLSAQIANARNYTSPKNDQFVGIIDQLVFTSTEFIAMKDRKPPRQLIGPVFTEQSLTMVSAPAGVGKSWFIHAIALALTRKEYTEIEVGPWQVKNPCGVLLIDGEMPSGLLRQRIMALEKPMGPEHTEMPLLLFIAEELAQQMDQQLNLSKVEWRDHITNFLKSKPDIKLLILDNISSLFPGGDENNKAAWDPVNQWLLALRRQGKSVILVHHTGKNGEYRGHSGRIDNLNNTIKLTPKRTNADNVSFEVKIDKGRTLLPGEGVPFGLRLIPSDDADGLILHGITLDKDRKQQIQADLLRGTMLKKDIAEKYGIKSAAISHHVTALKDNGYLDPKGAITKNGQKHLAELEESDTAQDDEV